MSELSPVGGSLKGLLKVIGIVGGVILLLVICWACSGPVLSLLPKGTGQQAGAPTQTVPGGQPPAKVYDAAYARSVCGDRPVDSFDPATGKVECARWESTKVSAAAAPTATSVSQTAKPAVQPKPQTQPQAAKCRVIHDSVVVETMDHISTSGSQIHLEYWWEGQPEKETFFNATQGAGGRFNFTRSLKGWVWEYAGCTDAEVKAQIDAHISRRKAGGANNAGYVQWETTGLFSPAK